MRMLAAMGALCLIGALCACKGSGRTESNTAPSPAAAAGGVKISEVRTGDRWTEQRLVRGFYPVTEGWRWTQRTFAVALDPPPPLDAPTFLDVDVTAPHELIAATGPVTLTIRTAGLEVGRRKFTEPGRSYLRFPVAAADLQPSPVLFEFELDRSMKQADGERGLIVVAALLVHPENTPLSQDDALEAARQGYLQLLQQRKAGLPDAKQQELMKLFHDIPVWRRMWFHNVAIAKNPLDLWMMQQIIYELKPDFIVETGTLNGGSALYWAHTLNGAGLESARVITVDIQDLTATAAQHPLWKKYVTFFKGSSTDPAIVNRIATVVAGRRTLVTLDSDHSGPHVLNELKSYSPMVSPGSYLVVEDTHMDGVPTQPEFGRGPYWAVLEFLKTGGNSQFEQDLSREAFILTFNPGGWLRRR